MYGGFAGGENSLEERVGLFSQTVLSGDLSGDDVVGPGGELLNYEENSYSVVFTQGPTLIDGFLITGGNSTDSGVLDAGGLYATTADLTARNCAFVRNRGGGLRSGQGVLVVEKCAFVDNEGATHGGGLYHSSNPPNPVIRDCSFRGNSSTNTAGAFWLGGGGGSAVIVEDCAFENNSSIRGGAVRILTSPTAYFLKCRFEGNESLLEGGAVWLETLGAFTNCSFVGNRSTEASFGDGGAIYGSSFSNATIVNCLFNGNFANDRGGAMYFDGASVSLSESTVVNNTAGTEAGGVHQTDVFFLLQNSVVWNNSDAGPLDQSAQFTIVGDSLSLNSCVQGWDGSLPGMNNFGLDPLLNDLDGSDDVAGNADDDLRLQIDSPCLDAADNGQIDEDFWDFDGDGDFCEPVSIDLLGCPRILDGDGDGSPVADMGAFEVCLIDFDYDLDSGDSVVLDPSLGAANPVQDVLASITNTTQRDDASVSLAQVDEDLHPDTSGYGVFSLTAVVQTVMNDGDFFMTISVPFTAAELAGANPLLLDLAYVDAANGQWELAVSGNTASSPGHSGLEGDRIVIVDGPRPDPWTISPDLGDYGVYWSSTLESGYVWANVDHATDFAAGIKDIAQYGCSLNPPESLAPLAGLPELGTTMTVGLDDPVGASPAGSVAALLISLDPDPDYPCGTALPGYGMTGPTGELLVGILPPNPIAVLGPLPWSGPGTPTEAALPIPMDAGLTGIELFLQGVIAGTGSVKFTDGMRVRLGP